LEHAIPFPENLLQDYAAAWSSGDPEAVANLYAPDVVRQDTLFGYDLQRSSAIKEFTKTFFAWYPGVRLELHDSLKWSARDLGSLYSIHVSDQTGKPCDVRAIILLESSQDKIINERLFYNADSLIACGWAQ
jgi:ketosteroid isomerase-like protein